MAVLTSIQQRLDEHAAFMQQQAPVILDLQQQHRRIINPEEDEDENEAFNANPKGFGNYGGNNNGGLANPGPAMDGMPNNN